MTLSFLTKWPDKMPDHLAEKPNYFISKIWMSIFKDNPERKRIHEYFGDQHVNALGKYWDVPNVEISPKIHTIRADAKDRWIAGLKIHPVINNRRPDRFQFAPEIFCIAIQSIEIISLLHKAGHTKCSYCVEIVGPCGGSFLLPFDVKIDGRLMGESEVITLAKNDGFECADDFFAYFNEDFTGKIIHWTDLMY